MFGNIMLFLTCSWRFLRSNQFRTISIQIGNMQENFENPYFYFFISDIEADIAALRSQNPRLLVLASLGGEAVKATTFSSFITDRESLNNLTSSINNHYRSGLLDGVEIDWEWPFQGGDKKDRIKMIRYARVRIRRP